MTLITAVGVIAGVIAFIILMDTLITFSVYGGFIKEKELDIYLGKNLKDYTFGPSTIKDDKPVLMSIYKIDELDKPFIAQTGASKYWYIHGYGIIAPWSKWSKNIKIHHEMLLEKVPAPKTLKDL